jgi:hypothetical protein
MLSACPQVSMGSMAAADVQRQKMFLSTTHGANASTISLSRDGTSEMTILGTTDLVLYYNDGNLGTGTAQVWDFVIDSQLREGLWQMFGGCWVE